MLGRNKILASDLEFGLTVLSVTDKQLVSGGLNHTAALRANGQVYSWGKNNLGQMGDGSTGADVLAPRASTVAIGEGFTSVAAGGDFTVALRRDGVMYAWGNNGTGSLGNDSNVNSPSPVQVIGDGFTAVSVGGLHVLALSRDGTLWAWGYNGEGQVGDQSTTNRWKPKQITSTSPSSSSND